MDKEEKLKGMFPDYFKRFEMPSGAHREGIKVYRACKTGECDDESFLPTYEENGFQNNGCDSSDPGLYSVSTYEKPKDVKRFTVHTSEYGKPYRIALGITDPKCGLVQRSKERILEADKKKKANSHVDWWLFEKSKRESEPYKSFSIIEDFDKHYEEYKKERKEERERIEREKKGGDINNEILF